MVGHYVTGIIVQAQAARHVATRQPDAAFEALANIEKAGADAMVVMRRMVGGLRNNNSTQPRTWEDVDQLVANAAAHGEPVTANIDADVRCVEPALVPSVHRIIAESLTNVRRHARNVTVVEVGAFRDNDHLVVTVRNDGQTAALSGHDAFGIIGMRERAASLGGSLIAGPTPNGGWLVRAELPTVGHR